LAISSNLHYYVQKQVQFMSFLSMNKYTILSSNLNKGYTVIFLFNFGSTTCIIKVTIYLCSKFFAF
jgi:hypothetical protein